jgi:thiol-disulfide isomerase/thioredoxin
MSVDPAPHHLLRQLTCCLLLLAGTAAAGEELHWLNEDSMEGELLGIDGPWLTWKSPLLADPIQLDKHRLYRWTNSPPRQEPSTVHPSWHLRLLDGSQLRCEITEWAADKTLLVHLHNWQATALQPSAAADWLQPKPRGPLLFAGPTHLEELKPVTNLNSRDGLPGQSWFFDSKGYFQTPSLDQATSLPLSLPEQTRIDLVLHTTDHFPQFRLITKRNDQSFSLETWLADLVALTSEDDFTPVTILTSKRLSITLTIDFPSNQATAYDNLGQQLAQWQLQPSTTPKTGSTSNLLQAANASMNAIMQAAKATNPADQGSPEKKASPGLTLTNLGSQLSLQQLFVRQWDGQPPAARPHREAFIETTNGSVHPGRVLNLTEKTATLEDGTSLATPDILWIHLPPPETILDQPLSYAVLHNGYHIHGLLQQADSRQITLSSPAFPDGHILKRHHVTQLHWHLPTDQHGPPPQNDSHHHRWLKSDLSILSRGRWHPAPGNTPHWAPDGALQAAAITLRDDAWSIEIPSYGTPADQKAPAIAHTHDGEALPIDIQQWNTDGIQFRSPISSAPTRQLPSKDLHLIHLPDSPIITTDFSDPGWIIHHQRPAPPSTGNAQLHLQPSGSASHSSMLLGNSMQLSFSSDSYGGIRLQLFTDGINPKSASLPLLFWQSSNTIYCGVEDSKRPGNTTGNQVRINTKNRHSAQISLSWTERQLTARINDNFAFRFNLHDRIRSGKGLRIEPAGMWGNEARPITLSGFSAAITTGSRRLPALDQDTKQWLLQIPRQYRDKPPGHLLIAHNGDILRGTLQQLTPQQIQLRNGMETFAIPTERVAMIILPKILDQPPPPPQETETANSPPQKPDTLLTTQDPPAPDIPILSPFASTGEHWVKTKQGATIRLKVTHWGPQHMEADSVHLGPCRIPFQQITSLSNFQPTEATREHIWQLHHAPEPVIPQSASPPSPMANMDAPPFKLTLLDGSEFDLNQQRGKIIILDFWATWCGPCIRAMPDYMETAKQFPADKVQLIAVNLGQTREEVTQFIKTRQWELTVAMDFEQTVGQLYQAANIPHTVLISPNGKITWTHTGFSPSAASDLKTAIETLLSEQPQ